MRAFELRKKFVYSISRIVPVHKTSISGSRLDWLPSHVHFNISIFHNEYQEK